MNNTYENTVRGFTAAEALPADRAAFIRKAYMHLALAILAFSAMTLYLVSSNAGLWIAETMLSGPYAWLIVLGLFMGVSYVAQKWALSDTSRAQQYMGLIMFTVAESIVFLPLLFMAAHYSGVDVIAKAGVVTLGLFAGLSATVLITRKDFSFLGPILAIGGFVALGFIVSGIIFGFSIGSFFAFAMVIFAGGSILYETSNMLHRYNTNQYVAASLGLFASVALLFYYILMIFMGRD